VHNQMVDFDGHSFLVLMVHNHQMMDLDQMVDLNQMVNLDQMVDLDQMMDLPNVEDHPKSMLLIVDDSVG